MCCAQIMKKAAPKPKPAAPKPKPAPKAKPVKKIKSGPRNKGTAIVGTSGAQTGGKAFAAFGLVVPWIGIFAAAAQKASI